MSTEKRYQDCGTREKAWRCRHYLRIPFDTAYAWAWDRINCPPNEWDTFGLHWRLSVGIAQGRMNWMYQWEDVRDADDDSDEEES